MEKPVQFITIDKDGICGLTKEAEVIISNIKDKIAVVCVAGLYRTGKSYLLNRLLGRQAGFEIGPTTNSCTKGLWIWGEPIKLSDKDFSILIIDTEGLGSAFDDRNETIDMEIFCLGILLSSLLIYNSMKNIDEIAIESLALVVNFAKKIQSGFKELDSYINNFPSFLWVIRDFALDLVDSEGRNITASQYLEHALSIDESLEYTNDESLKKKNEIRKMLKIFFRERDCYTLIRPVSDEKKLRNIDKIPIQDLRSEFLVQIENFVQKVFLNVRPKLVQGSYLNGQTFVNLAKMYVDSINSNSIPDVKTSWKIVIDNQLSKVFDKILNFYIDEMLQLDFKKIASIEELLKHHNETKSIALDYLNEFANINVPSMVFLDSVKKLEEKIGEKFFEILSKWKEFSETKCNKITEEIIKEYKSNNEDDDIYTGLELIEDVFKFVDESVDNSRKYELIYPKVLEFFVDALKRGFRENKTNYENEMKLLQHDSNVVKGVLDKTKETLGKEREEYENEIRKLKDEIMNMRLEHEAKLDEKTKTIKILQSNHENNLEEYKTKISTLNNMLETQKLNEKEKKKTKKGKEDGLLDLKIENILEKLDGFKEIFLKTELERAKMQLQIEMSSRIEEVETEFMKKLNTTKKLCEKTVIKLKNAYQEQINNLKQLIKELYDEINDFKCQVSSQEYKIELYKEKIIAYEKDKKTQTDHAELLRVLTGKLNNFIDKMGKK